MTASPPRGDPIKLEGLMALDANSGEKLPWGEVPVEVVDYDERWPLDFQAESAGILPAVGPAAVALEHIGSTSVPGLAAKPIIDLLLGVRRLEDIDPYAGALRALGYEREVAAERMILGRRFFYKGPPHAETHHLHISEVGTRYWVEPLAFRDWLRAHPEDREEYARLKRELATSLPRTKYTWAKAPFVEAIVARALRAGALEQP